MEKQIIVFGDTHYSKNWDTIDQCLKQIPHFSEKYLNPNQELRKFIELINQSPHVEAVINNGDSIDYHFSDFISLLSLLKNRSDSERISNWDLFNSVINHLKKQYIAIPGNHDYRKEAYNYAIWGTDHINLSKATRKKFKHQIGHQTFRGPWELASVMVNEKRFDPLTKGMHIKKREDIRIAMYHCIFLDSGSDAFVRAANFFKCLKKFLETRVISYDSDGLNQDDFNYLSQALSKNISKDILIFQHAPLINPKKSCIGREYQLSIDTFDELSRKQKISHDTILNGGAELLKLLKNTDKNIVLISSHIHNAKYFLIDKKSLSAKEVSNSEFNREKNTVGIIKQMTTLPLGGIYPRVGGNKIGFLKISSNGFEEQILHNFSDKGK